MPGLSGEIEGFLKSPHRAIPSAWDFKQCGQSGRHISTLFPHLGECVDDLAFVFGIKVDNNNHGPATMHMNTGSPLQGNASVGSWVSYGLGSPNQNLPAYVVSRIPEGLLSMGLRFGEMASYPLRIKERSSARPARHHRSRPARRAQPRAAAQEFDLIKWLNERHNTERPGA